MTPRPQCFARAGSLSFARRSARIERSPGGVPRRHSTGGARLRERNVPREFGNEPKVGGQCLIRTFWNFFLSFLPFGPGCSSKTQS
jgi:hypothetical protein